MLNQTNIFVIASALILIGCSVEDPKGSRFAQPAKNNSLTNKTFEDGEFDCSQRVAVSEPIGLQLQDQPTYLADIKPLVDKQCITCHNPNGNSPDLTDYAKLKAHAESSRTEISAGSMPLIGALETANMELFERWVELDMPESEATNNSADAMVKKCL